MPDEFKTQSAASEPVTPCMAACPALTDNRTVARLVCEGRYEEALFVLLDANPFPSVCGRICHAWCEDECRRGKVDSCVSLRRIKRFITEKTSDFRKTHRRKSKPATGKRVAIVGAGPAGLAAAAALALSGHTVTVFEKLSEPGGMLYLTIPRYRLPNEAVKEDIDWILSLGVTLKTGVSIGTDVKIESLEKDFDAVIIATGLPDSRALDVPGIDSTGIHLAVPFLEAARAGKPWPLGKVAIVIGGGNVAIDAARTALRLSPVAKVTVVCLEKREEMPAWKDEIVEAVAEGVKLVNSFGPKRVVAENGAVKNVEFKKCKRVFDERGAFAPVFDDSEVIGLNADTIIIAIGQKDNLSSVLPGLKFDPVTLSAGGRPLFAAGDAVSGPTSVVHAVASGRRAAEAVERFFATGKILSVECVKPPVIPALPENVVSKITRIEGVRPDAKNPIERKKDFSEIERAYSEEEALREARRCLACALGARVNADKCAACLNCTRVCAFSVPAVKEKAEISPAACVGCGFCAAECPALAIDVERLRQRDFKNEIRRILDASPYGAVKSPMSVTVVCDNAFSTRAAWEELKKGMLEHENILVSVPCAEMISINDIFGVLGMGVKSISIAPCSKTGSCAYPAYAGSLEKRVVRVREMLSSLGLDGGVVRLSSSPACAPVKDKTESK
jgi:NADPH-dependent glutamate synthase beta subunit-like oxidoreductase/coenzyme F420-reducing hydrogenase delta subunit